MERETAAGLESLDKMQQLCGKVGMVCLSHAVCRVSTANFK
jgi:hypothetical protein